MTNDWYRNTAWDAATEQAFEVKLQRSRRKEQYLRVQASTLAKSHPEVALRLLARYFELPDNFDHAQAYVDRAEALLALGRTEDAISSFEAALTREAAFPKLKTDAYLDLPYLIATRKLGEHFGRALELLRVHEGRRLFPIDRFRWHAAHALIFFAIAEHRVSKAHASEALDAAAQLRSGWASHPKAGLISESHAHVVAELEAIAIP